LSVVSTQHHFRHDHIDVLANTQVPVLGAFQGCIANHALALDAIVIVPSSRQSKLDDARVGLKRNSAKLGHNGFGSLSKQELCYSVPSADLSSKLNGKFLEEDPT
jgi:hypothetical protein